MGQLEKYGLYVLCLVICLILGVAIWGGDPGSSTIDREGLERAAADANRQKAKPKIDAGTFFDPAPNEPRGETGGRVLGEGDLKPDGADSASGNEAKKPAGGPSQPPVLPAPLTYTVRKGDTPEEIARKELGDGRRVKELLALNPEIRDPSRDLKPDMTLKLPPRAVASDATKGKGKDARDKEAAFKPGDVRPAVYVVKSGDNPHRIAERVLGATAKGSEIAAFAEELVRLNQITDATRLKPDTQLRLPPRSK